jgi:hypothetical protein
MTESPNQDERVKRLVGLLNRRFQTWESNAEQRHLSEVATFIRTLNGTERPWMANPDVIASLKALRKTRLYCDHWGIVAKVVDVVGAAAEADAVEELCAVFRRSAASLGGNAHLTTTRPAVAQALENIAILRVTEVTTHGLIFMTLLSDFNPTKWTNEPFDGSLVSLAALTELRRRIVEDEVGVIETLIQHLHDYASWHDEVTVRISYSPATMVVRAAERIALQLPLSKDRLTDVVGTAWSRLSVQEERKYNEEKLIENCVALLGGTRSLEHVALLITVSQDKSEGIRATAALALGLIRDRRARERLSEMAQVDASIHYVREHARRALEQAGPMNMARSGERARQRWCRFWR